MNYFSKSMQQMTTSNVQKLGGGAPSITQKVMSFMKSRTMIYIIIALLLIFIGYYIYKQYTSVKAGFHANREHVPKDNSNKTANLMLFYVDWCPHCKTAKPEWESLKTEYEGKKINGYTIVFTEHNCTTETPEIEGLMDKYKIEGYPTIKLIKDNQVIEYDAKPTKSTMEQFLNTVL
jgi:thiol-disulfide isomerase/thioredoxin